MLTIHDLEEGSIVLSDSRSLRWEVHAVLSAKSSSACRAFDQSQQCTQCCQLNLAVHAIYWL